MPRQTGWALSAAAGQVASALPWISLAMLAAGALLVLGSLLLLLRGALRLRRRAVQLRATVAAGRHDIESALSILAAHRAETADLLAPWQQLARWARHPLVGATIEWYRRRRARA